MLKCCRTIKIEFWIIEHARQVATAMMKDLSYLGWPEIRTSTYWMENAVFFIKYFVKYVYFISFRYWT